MLAVVTFETWQVWLAFLASVATVSPFIVVALKKTGAFSLWWLYLEMQKIRVIAERNAHELKQNGGSTAEEPGTLKDVIVETKQMTFEQTPILKEIVENQRQVKSDLLANTQSTDDFKKEIRSELGVISISFWQLVIHMDRGTLPTSRLLQIARQKLPKEDLEMLEALASLDGEGRPHTAGKEGEVKR